DSVPRKGSRVSARFRFRHIERPPLTIMTETMLMLVFGHPEIDFRYWHTRNGLRFSYFRRALPDRAAASADVAALRDSLRAGLKRIGVS
ncbi:MAG: hypothetical protein Q8N53_18420, partial [Longimicrobiales bacterium]|nr:hypothetical protein [Longimicrobiales bacterium]